MNIALVIATRADKPVVDWLLQLYEYDVSEIGEIDVNSRGVY